MIPPFCKPAAILAACLCLPFSPATAGTARFEFTGGSLAATATDLPAGVTVSSLSIGGGLELGGGTDALRFESTDTQNSTATAIDGGAYVSFTLTIAEGTVIDLTSLSADYNSTLTGAFYSNSRVYSSIDDFNDVTGDTIGVIGRQSGEGAAGTNSLNLTNPAANVNRGANVAAGDFTGLTNRTVTFYFPWVDSGSGTYHTDLDNLTLNVTAPVPPVVSSLRITDFHLLSDRSAQVSFAGDNGAPFSLVASGDLTGPLYRKRWSLLKGGNFEGTAAVHLDAEAAALPRRFYSVASGGVPKARILPVGDSITAGDGAFWVYRGPLYDKLTAAGCRFEYVGWNAANYLSAANGTVSLKFGAQGGDNAAIVASKLAANFPSNVADIVLIHAGHNYDLKSESESTIIGKIETATRSMIATCRLTNPKVIILLAQVITSPKLSENSTVVKYAYIPALNIRLAEVAAELNTAMSPLIIVNQAEGWNTPTDAVGDLVHPSEAGAEKMAAKWFNALLPLLE